MPSPFQLREGARLLHAGGVLAYPTEAVYGLGCDPLNAVAVQHLLTLKQRAAGKGLILIAADFEQLKPFVQPCSEQAMARLRATWPGPVTWLLPATDEVPEWLSGDSAKIAVRVTAHPVASALCRAFGGALVSTSANLTGRQPARSALQVRLRCPGADAILCGSLGRLRRPTPISDAETGEPIRI